MMVFYTCFLSADSHIWANLLFFLCIVLMDLEKAISQFFASLGQSVRKILKVVGVLLVVYILSSSAWFIVEPGER